MIATVPDPEIGGLIARRKDTTEVGDDIVRTGPTHKVESLISTRAVTRCGRQMEKFTSQGRGLVCYPLGVHVAPSCQRCLG